MGPKQAGGITLSGDMDTVPVDGQSRTSNPICLREENGRLYGRGATDMKGFVACALAAVPEVLKLGIVRPLHLLLTYDEELGSLVAPKLIADIKKSGLAPSFCVVGGPSGMHRPIHVRKMDSVEMTSGGKPAAGIWVATCDCLIASSSGRSRAPGTRCTSAPKARIWATLAAGVDSGHRIRTSGPAAAPKAATAAPARTDHRGTRRSIYYYLSRKENSRALVVWIRYLCVLQLRHCRPATDPFSRSWERSTTRLFVGI